MRLCFASAIVNVYTLTLSCLYVYQAHAQNIYLGPFRSDFNPYYWKNKLPKPGYWQQDVAYTIEAEIDDSLDLIKADRYELKYYNNSPDTLYEAFFHVYDNAFIPDSYYDKLQRANKLKPKFGPYQSQKKGIEIQDFKVDKKPVSLEFDNTIFKVYLHRPLLPGDSVTFSCRFVNHYDHQGSMRNRNKMLKLPMHKQFDGVHWYPIICVYDAEFGWHTDQHLDKEFYANFGSFDIKLTLPAHYIVEATGVLQNQDEAMPDSLRKALDLSNFSTKKYKGKPTEVIPNNRGQKKTWKYFATNVHNFAFTADPTYRIDEKEIHGIKVIAMVQEQNASKWIPSAAFTTKIIEVYMRDFGTYIWPKIVIADADDGMEYPMLTLDGGSYPQHQYLLAHEVGHMWFYGMVANNETYRAPLDEGFTQFLTIWAMDRVTGKKKPRLVTKNKWVATYKDSIENRMDRMYLPYIADVITGYDEPLNTHASAYNGAVRHGGSYRLVYYKTGAMLYNLRYVLGDSLFLKSLRHYVRQWTGAHPYPDDFRKSITSVAKTDLTWFFDQWMETTKYTDYGIRKVKRIAKTNDTTWIYSIKLRRYGRMQMPIEFQAKTRNKTYNYYIPNTWFAKQHITPTTQLPKWYGWDLLNRDYEAVITVNGVLRSIQIDTGRILADIDLRDNGKPGIYAFQLDHMVSNHARWDKYTTYWRPDIWYNGFDGLQIGIHTRNAYFAKHEEHEMWVWGHTRVGQQDIPSKFKRTNDYASILAMGEFSHHTVWRQLYSTYEIRSLAGIQRFRMGFKKRFSKQDLTNPRQTLLELHHSVQYREAGSDSLYLLYPQYWSSGQYNNYTTARITRTYPIRNNGKGWFAIESRSPGLFSDVNYSYLQLESRQEWEYRKIELRTRLLARLGSKNTPLESALYLAGASPEGLIQNPYTRAKGFIPNQYLGYDMSNNHFQMGGGLNVRGMAGYLAPIQAQNDTYFVHLGQSGIACNAELDFDRLIPIKGRGILRFVHVDMYVFGDIGSMAYVNKTGSKVLSTPAVSTGLGTAVTFSFGHWAIKPITLRADLPLLTTFIDTKAQSLPSRVIFGFQRAF